MDKEIIDNNNILIAKFMGWHDKITDTLSGESVPRFYNEDESVSLSYMWDYFGEMLQYHSNWNVLMEVIERLGNTTVKSTASYNPDYQIRIEIVNGYTKIEGLGKRIFYNSSVCGSMLLATYGAVVEAIERVNYLTEKYINSKTQTNG